MSDPPSITAVVLGSMWPNGVRGPNLHDGLDLGSGAPMPGGTLHDGSDAQSMGGAGVPSSIEPLVLMKQWYLAHITY